MRRTPARGEPHARTWLSWPADGRGDPAGPEGARWASCEAVAQAIASFEPLTVLTGPGSARAVRARVPETATVIEVPSEQPTEPSPLFVIGPDGVELVAPHREVPTQRRWLRRSQTGQAGPVGLGGLAGVQLVESGLPLGTVRADGWGTVLATESVLLGATGRPRDEVEAELVARTGALRVVWLPTGLGDPSTDRAEPAATFAAPGLVLVHDQHLHRHPDHAVTAAAVAAVEAARDSRGLRMRVVRVPAPARATDAEGAWVHWSYLDHLLVNGGVVAPVFDDVRDGEVIDLLAEVHPGRQVIGVDARPLSGPGRSLCSCAVGQPAERPAAALEPHRAVAGTGPS